MNDVMRAVVCVPGLFSFLERFPPAHSKKTLYRHAEYATEHTEAQVPFNFPSILLGIGPLIPLSS